MDATNHYRPYQVGSAVAAGLGILGCAGPWISFSFLGASIDISGLSSWYGRGLALTSLLVGLSLGIRPRATNYVSAALIAAMLGAAILGVSLFDLSTHGKSAVHFLGWGYYVATLGVLAQLGFSIWLAVDNALRREAGLTTD